MLPNNGRTSWFVNLIETPCLPLNKVQKGKLRSRSDGTSRSGRFIHPLYLVYNKTLNVMRKLLLLLTFCCLLALLPRPSQAQYNPNASYDGPARLNTWSVSAHGGWSQFYGDLREYDFFPVGADNFDSVNERNSFFGGLTVGKQLSHLFGLQLGVNAGNLRGMKRRLYYSYFRSSFVQTDLTGSVNLKSLLFGVNKMKHWKVDAYTGVGVMFYNAKAFELTTGRLRRQTGDVSDLVVPMGLAVHYELGPRFDIGIDIRVNHVNSERLDATIGGDASSLFDLVGNRGSLSETFVRQGNSAKDKWGYGGIMLTYKLGRRAIRVQKVNDKFDYDTTAGTYHLRWTDPKSLIKPPVILTLAQIDSVAKANRPPDIDPKLLTDTDNDGVSDYFDKEPNSPTGSVVSGSGEVIDFDKYVSAALPGIACAEIFANIEFDTDKSALKPQFKEVLNKVVELMNKSQCRLQLAGHADRRASDKYNLALSRRRVEAVRTYLIEAGLNDPSRILVDYFGAYKPIADPSKTGMQKNRRVEMKLIP